MNTITSSVAIHSRALLVSLSISTWTARKYDKRITQKVNNDMNASSDAGRYNKCLLPGDAKSYKALMSLASSIRVQHYSKTLAWSNEGDRLLPTDNFNDYTTWFRDMRTAFNDALTTFVLDYPALYLDAQRHLNGAWKPEDYPDQYDIRSRFAIDVNYSPIPAVDDIRVNLAADQIADIEESITNRIESATKIAVHDAWTRLHGVVSHIAERLADPDAIFRDSLIGNAREVCDVLKRLNVTNDPDLESMRQLVERELTHTDPEDLRDVKHVRADVAAKAESILSAMSGLYGSL